MDDSCSLVSLTNFHMGTNALRVDGGGEGGSGGEMGEGEGERKRGGGGGGER